MNYLSNNKKQCLPISPNSIPVYVVWTVLAVGKGFGLTSATSQIYTLCTMVSVAIGCLALLVIDGKSYFSPKERQTTIYQAVAIALGTLSLLASGDTAFLLATLLIAMMRDVEATRLVRYVLILLLVISLTRIVLALLGILDIQMVFSYDRGVPRYALGFDHPNSAQSVLAYITALLVASDLKISVKRVLSVAFLAMSCFVFTYTGSRTGLIIAIMMTIGVLLPMDVVRNILKFVLPLLIMLPFVAIVLSVTYPAWSPLVDLSTFESRFLTSNQLFTSTSITLFGTECLHTDCGYIAVLFENGILGFTCFYLVYGSTLIRLYKRGLWHALMVSACYAIFCLSEAYCTTASLNPMVLLAPLALFSKNGGNNALQDKMQENQEFAASRHSIKANQVKHARMRILYITNIHNPYRDEFFDQLGKQISLTVLFEKISDKNRDASWFEESFEHSYEERYLPEDSNVHSLKSMVSTIKEGWSLVVIGCYNSPQQIFAVEYMKLRRIPYVINSDEPLYASESLVKQSIRNYVLRGANAYLVAGDRSIVSMRAEVGNSALVVSYPFSSLTEKRIEKIRSLNYPRQVRRILIVGQFLPYKGIDVALKAISKLSFEADVMIIGVGKRYKECEECAHTLGLQHVKVIQFIRPKELYLEYMQASLLVLPSRQECWGLVINEAAACGCPVVSTWGSGAAVEFIAHDYPEFLAEPGNADSLTYAIETFFKMAEHDKQAYSSFLQRKANDYSIEKMVKRHLCLFERVIQDE